MLASIEVNMKSSGIVVVCEPQRKLARIYKTSIPFQEASPGCVALQCGRSAETKACAWQRTKKEKRVACTSCAASEWGTRD